MTNVFESFRWNDKSLENVVYENWVKIKEKDPNKSQMKELYQ